VAVAHDGEFGRHFAWCESNRLEQVLVNLLGNSLDATAGTAEPKIAISVTTRLLDAARWTCIEVRDNGPGLTEAARRQLFEPFFTTKSSGAGLGLGLVISRQILQDFGGELTLENAEDGGAVALLTIPAEPAAPAGQAGPADARAPVSAPALSGSSRIS